MAKNSTERRGPLWMDRWPEAGDRVKPSPTGVTLPGVELDPAARATVVKRPTGECFTLRIDGHDGEHPFHMSLWDYA